MIKFLLFFILIISSCDKKDDIGFVHYMEPIESTYGRLTGNEIIATPEFSKEYMKLINDHRIKLALD